MRSRKAAARIGGWAAAVAVVAGLGLALGDAPRAASQSAPAPTPDDRWPQFRGNPSLTGVTAAKLPDTLRVMWTYDAGEAIESSAAIDGGVVYVGTGAGELLALDLDTGKPRWNYKAAEIAESSPAVAGGLVYVGDET